MTLKLFSLFVIAVVMSSAAENASATSSTVGAAFVTPLSTTTTTTTTATQSSALRAESDRVQVGAEQRDSAIGIPLLPAADPEADIPRLKLGEVMRFEEMGPIIINLDGTTRRIDNWDEMTEREREVTWRRISKRNEERRKILLEKMEQEQKQENLAKQEGANDL